MKTSTCRYCIITNMDSTEIGIVIGITLLLLCLVCCFIQCRRSNTVIQDGIV